MEQDAGMGLAILGAEQGRGRGRSHGRGRGCGRGIREVGGQHGQSSYQGRVRGQSVPVDSNAPDECEDGDLEQDLWITCRLRRFHP